MAGAPGGNFVGKASENHETRADSLAVNLRLNAGQQVKLFLGQEGRCICDKNIKENLMGDQKDLVCFTFTYCFQFAFFRVSSFVLYQPMI